jgi:hypothetical protein
MIDEFVGSNIGHDEASIGKRSELGTTIGKNTDASFPTARQLAWPPS